MNKTKKIRAIIYQKDAVRGPEEEYRKIELGPNGECEYSWDEPTKTKKLKMRFSVNDEVCAALQDVFSFLFSLFL